MIGRLQRYATDPHDRERKSPYARAPTGKRVAIVGAGPAGWPQNSPSPASTVRFQPREKAGGLYGAACKTADDFAARESDFILDQRHRDPARSGARPRSSSDLRRDYDAVFVGASLGATNKLGLPRGELANVIDAVDYRPPRRQDLRCRLAAGLW